MSKQPIIIIISCLVVVLYFVIYLVYFLVVNELHFNYGPIHYSRGIVGTCFGRGGNQGDRMNEKTSRSLCVGFQTKPEQKLKSFSGKNNTKRKRGEIITIIKKIIYSEIQVFYCHEKDGTPPIVCSIAFIVRKTSVIIVISFPLLLVSSKKKKTQENSIYGKLFDFFRLIKYYFTENLKTMFVGLFSCKCRVNECLSRNNVIFKHVFISKRLMAVDI